MKRIVWRFGLIAGGVLALFTGVVFPLAMTGGSEVVGSQLLGYSTMVLAFLAVFFGIRSYRETVGGGAISFGKAFQVGILIALIASAMYVAGWQVAFWGFIPDFGDRYAAATLEKMRAEGASEAELAAQRTNMEKFRKLYRNPFFNVAITFVEVLPVGLVISLVSAAILRKKPGGGDGTAATAAA